MCNGQLLPINQNQALFSLLGTTFGGNGQTTFALPDLRGRVPIHVGSGHTLGERAASRRTRRHRRDAHARACRSRRSTLDGGNTPVPTNNVCAASASSALPPAGRPGRR